MNSKKDKLYTSIAILIIGSLMALSLYKWWNRPSFYDSGKLLVMNTVARIIVVDEDPEVAKQTAEAAFELIKSFNSTMNIYDNESLISKVNSEAYNNPVQLNSEL